MDEQSFRLKLKMHEWVGLRASLLASYAGISQPPFRLVPADTQLVEGTGLELRSWGGSVITEGVA